MMLLIENIRDWLISLFVGWGLNTAYSELIVATVLILATLVAALIIDKVSRYLLHNVFNALVKKSKTDWDDLLVENRVFSAIAHIVPVIFVFMVLPHILGNHPTANEYIDRISQVIITITFIVVLFRFLNTLRTILGRVDLFKDKPIDSYFQLAKIVIGIILGIFSLAILTGQSLTYFFGAFGAMTAVLILVFKDTILGFIASIQLAANDMIRVGDWVQMDKFGADGDVIGINLTTVKVRNWDKTITTVPTYAFISDSFKNWRGMQEIGARRISRSIYIDQNSVKFVDENLINRFQKIQLLKQYIDEKENEISKHNADNQVDESNLINGRRMTNLGTFRAYLKHYIDNHPKIDKNLTILVRQLAPAETGIPIQIYAFCSDIEWVNYEGVQSDIFDHALAIVGEFDLKIFQNPSGSDFSKLASR